MIDVPDQPGPLPGPLSCRSFVMPNCHIRIIMQDLENSIIKIWRDAPEILRTDMMYILHMIGKADMMTTHL